MLKSNLISPLFIALSLSFAACDADGLDEEFLDAELDVDAEFVDDDDEARELTPDTTPQLAAEVDVQAAGSWTSWYDRDNSSGNGDYESSFLQSGVCATPTGVECQTTSGLALWQTGENVTCSTTVVRCVNAEQPDGICNYDYRVRFLCPTAPGGGGGDGGGDGGGGECLLDPCPIAPIE